MAPGGAPHTAFSADVLTLNPPSFAHSLPLTSPFPPSTRGLLSVAGAVPLGLARGHLIVCHWVGPRKGITATGMVATPHSLLSPAFKAGMALSSAGVWCGGGLLSASLEVSKLGIASIPSHVFTGSGSENVNSARVLGGGGHSVSLPPLSSSSSGGGGGAPNPFASLSMGGDVMRARTPPHTSYLEACRTAATLGATLPPSALAACASDWSSAGATTAALLLPNLPITLGIGIALSTRPAVAALVTPPTTSPRHQPQAQALNPLSRFSTLDAMMACSYLLTLLRDVSDEELWSLGGAAQGCSVVPPSSSSSSSSPIFHHSSASPPWELEGSVNTLGVWPSVAILLALSATGTGEVGGGGGFPVATPRETCRALVDFSRRLSHVGLHRDALFVGAVSGGEGGSLESPGFEVILNSLTPSLSEAVRKLTEITTRA